jgi:hypothetical protein
MRTHTVPMGASFSPTIVKADTMYRELAEFLPGQVAIWTTDHDVDCEQPARVRPAARFSKDDLRDRPVAIATHALFQGDSAEKARIAVRFGRLSYRALTVVDEQMEDVIVHDTSFADAAAALKWSQDQQHTAVTPHLYRLAEFMLPKTTTGAQIEKPKDDKSSWRVAEDLRWFATDEAAYYAQRNSASLPRIEAVFGFARAMVRDYAFIASGPRGPSFIGYEPRHVVVPGMVLLDATADLDGITRLCTWRAHVEVPRGDFRSLHIVHVPALTTDPLTAFCRNRKNRRRYVDRMKEIILQQVGPGQRTLVVCKKMLIGRPEAPGENVPDWPANDKRFDDPTEYQVKFGWDLEGRDISLTWWGGPGVGSNAWRDAQVVVLFDEFFRAVFSVVGSAVATVAHLFPAQLLGEPWVRGCPCASMGDEGVRAVAKVEPRGSGRPAPYVR